MAADEEPSPADDVGDAHSLDDADSFDDEPQDVAPWSRWQRHLGLFLLTTFSVFLMGALQVAPNDDKIDSFLGLLLHGLRHIHLGWSFAVPLMAILLTHEFGHYFAALYHRVPASLPYFIPLPLLSPFGTMGAVIHMPARIKSRNALLDIGAAGPLAGMVVAVPVVLIGLSQSQVAPLQGGGFLEGQCLLYSALKYMAVGPIPDGHDVYLSPTAFAGWGGLLVTMLNLLPIGQLDGGHVAYALFDGKQKHIGRVFHYSLLGWFAFNWIRYDLIEPGMVWGVWFVLLFVLRNLSGGVDHPPTEPGVLSPGRKAVAVGTLILFVLLFMPTPIKQQALIARTWIDAVV
jgi:membrane-associated protease RseP (regulator of RpoE activity)